MGEKNGIRTRISGAFHGMGNQIKGAYSDFMALSREDKKRKITDAALNNAMYIMIIAAIIVIAILKPRFISFASVINVISLTAAKLPIALGIAGAIVLTGTDISAGRAVGLGASVAASLLQSASYSSKIFPALEPLPIPIVILAVVAIGALIGLINGFFVAK